MSLDPLFLSTAVEAALEAGRTQRRYFRQAMHVEKKGPIDLVTAADLEVERTFRHLIGARFPSHTVLGEEARQSISTGSSGSSGHHGYRWIIDPIDGTTNFAHGLALFCVSIALEVDGAIELGVVYDPMSDELFTAERGEGARVNGRRMAVSTAGTLIDSLLCTGFPYAAHEGRRRQLGTFGAFLTECRAVRRLGSAALDLSYVAAGWLDGFWEEQLHPWDIAAGALIVQEAGGTVTDLAGGPLDLARGNILASNGRIHELMLAVVQRTSGSERAAGAERGVGVQRVDSAVDKKPSE
jgi:myo-inositol-1(or 4)-monophosphatase